MLSTTILVKEADDRLHALVEQCKKFSDEILLVVDKGTKINWDGIRVVEFEWCNDFSAARNFAFEQCTNDYIFWVDADDEIDKPELMNELMARVVEEEIDWVAMPYIYVEQINARQYKERLFKKGTVKWEKTVHENPVETRPTKKILYEDVKVIHKKTPEEAKEVQQRNLTYMMEEFNRDKENTDPRTLLYIGKALTGIGQAAVMNGDVKGYEALQKANAFFMNYIPKSGWDEDKYFAILHLADNLNLLGKTEEAISYALGAMRLRPSWNKAYLDIGKFYLKDEPKKAIEFIKIGLSKESPKTMLLVNNFEETALAKAHLAEAYLSTIQVTKAKKIAKELKRYKLPILDELLLTIDSAAETEDYVKGLVKVLEYVSRVSADAALKILNEVPVGLTDDVRLHDQRKKLTPPKTWGDNEITIACPFAFETWADPSVLRGIGGSEEAVIYLSRELTKLGYKVTVYNKCRQMRGVYNGVTYLNDYEFNTNDKFNVLIAWRSPQFFLQDLDAKMKLVWMHDVPLAKFTPEMIDSFDKVMVLSKFHRSLIPEVPDEKIFLTSNGIVPEQFKNLPEKKPNTIFYGSSPDRGLECLIKDIMPLVKKKIPEATLHFCYGWATFDKMFEENLGAQEWKKKLLEKAEELGAIDHGRLNHTQLARLMGECMVHAYPTQFDEINCITVQKTQCAGCVPVTTDVAALDEFNRQGTKIKGNQIYTSKALQQQFANEIVQQLHNPKRINREQAIKEYKWENVAKSWQKLISGSLLAKTAKKQPKKTS